MSQTELIMFNFMFYERLTVVEVSFCLISYCELFIIGGFDERTGGGPFSRSSFKPLLSCLETGGRMASAESSPRCT